jgi:hypothetical protein
MLEGGCSLPQLAELQHAALFRAVAGLNSVSLPSDLHTVQGLLAYLLHSLSQQSHIAAL